MRWEKNVIEDLSEAVCLSGKSLIKCNPVFTDDATLPFLNQTSHCSYIFNVSLYLDHRDFAWLNCAKIVLKDVNYAWGSYLFGLIASALIDFSGHMEAAEIGCENITDVWSYKAEMAKPKLFHTLGKCGSVSIWNLVCLHPCLRTKYKSNIWSYFISSFFPPTWETCFAANCSIMFTS